MSDSKFNNFSKRRVTQAGFSLMELMISLTIGLVITVAALSAYVASSGAGRVADAQSRMNEDAQAALSTLSQQIRLAGSNPVQVSRVYPFRRNPVYSFTYAGGTSTAYIPLPYTVTLPTFSPSTYTLSGFAMRGCDGAFSNITATNTLDALTCGGTSTLPDSIAVSYESDRYNSVSVNSRPSDCLGQTLPIAATVTSASTNIPNGTTITVADNRFYIANQPNRSPTVPSLYCKGNGNTVPQPLVENVEDMQITYGVVSTTDTSEQSTIAGYLTAHGVETETSLAALANSGLRWGRVLSVRICIVVRSETPVAPDADSAKYYKCDGTLDSTKTDLRLRRAYSTTVVLRNRRS